MIGPSIDILGVALGSSSREMDWIKDSYCSLYENDINAHSITTGKSDH